MTKKEAIQDIIDRIEEIKDECEYEYIGIRIQEEKFTEGEILDNSYVWDDGECTDEELDGTCAINLDDAKLALENGYFGEHVAVIAGNNREWGKDKGEIIIREATVIEVLV
jgi:hypothetical protein